MATQSNEAGTPQTPAEDVPNGAGTDASSGDEEQDTSSGGSPEK
ncbi:MAG: hypothetical protein JWR53_1446 [Glaciihabitans sp.]|nr:hypothetical protein [Glaciihabitans sp.]